jgi:hypothetical protein
MKKGQLMDKLKWEMLLEINNRMEAELIKSLLKSQEIDVELFQESIGHTIYPVMVDGLGRVQIFVPAEKLEEARELLNSYQEGKNKNA